MVTTSTFPLLLKDLARLWLLHEHSGLPSALMVFKTNDLPLDNSDKYGSCPFREAKNPSNLESTLVSILGEKSFSLSDDLFSVKPSGELRDLHKLPGKLFTVGDKYIFFLSEFCFTQVEHSTLLFSNSSWVSFTNDVFESLSFASAQH